MSGLENLSFESLPPVSISGPHAFFRNNRPFVVKSTVFSPERYKSSDWFVDRIEELVPNLANKTMLEVGCGCGYAGQRLMLERGLKYLYSGDINPNAVACAIDNSQLNRIDHKVSVLLSNVFDAFPSQIKADLVYWNPPWIYVKQGEREKEIVRRGFYDPGYIGIGKYISEYHERLNPDGRAFLAFGESGRLDRLHQIAVWNGCKAELVACGKVGPAGKNGEVYLFELIRPNDVYAVQWPQPGRN